MRTILVRLAIVVVTIGIAGACSSEEEEGKVPLGEKCSSATDCDDEDHTKLRWCCDTASDGRVHVCRATNCYGI